MIHMPIRATRQAPRGLRQLRPGLDDIDSSSYGRTLLALRNDPRRADNARIGGGFSVETVTFSKAALRDADNRRDRATG